MSISETVIRDCLDCSNAVYSSNVDAVPFIIPESQPFQLLYSSTNDSDGFSARAYIDPLGNIIIAYEGSDLNPLDLTGYGLGSKAADFALAQGERPQALQDAIDFASEAKVAAGALGYGADPIYVTGHSLGGTEAEAAAIALNSSVQGGFISGAVTFGATGVPGYLSPGGNNDFINYVDYGDVVGNFANDSLSELSLLAAAVKMGSHFGSVDQVGSPLNAALIAAAFATDDVEALGALIVNYHILSNYAADLNLAFDPLVQGQTAIPNPNSTPDTDLASVFIQDSDASSSPSFSIISSPTISENAGRITFTIDETSALSQNLTIYVSTLQNWDGSGIYNTSTPGSHVSTNYYYDGLNTTPITFTATSATSSSQSISVAINPLGLTSGSETFGFEVEEMNSNGALYEVAEVPFTIVNQNSTTSAPTISSVTSSVSGGSVLNAGRSVTFSVTFSAPVTVNQAGGPPFLTLNDNESASYTGGSGTNTLTFLYNVSPGDHTSDLQVTGLTVPNGSRIADLTNDAAVTTGATENTGIQINTAAPTVVITTTGGLTAEATQTISGTVDVADAGTTVTVFDGANNIGSAVVAGNGTWSTNVTLSVTGPNTLVAKDTNSAGNTGVSNQIFFNYDTATYTIVPTNPVATENQGTLTFTVTRANDTSADDVFVQTDENHGSANPNSEYFQEQNLIPVFFPQYASSATFSTTINDIHATSGSQTFGVSIYPTLSTSGGALASTTFTIDDTDTNTGLLTGTIITNDTVTGTTTVSTPVFIEDNATLTNDGVIDINSGGSIGGDNAGGVISNVQGSVINIDAADGASRTIDVTRIVNGGTIVASPGAGNVATVAVANGSISDAGSIQALSGTLLLGMFGSSGTANLNASGLSVAASASLQFIGAGTFTLTGNYSNPGSTIVGSSTQIADVVFAAGSNVNLGGNWILDGGSLDLSAATLAGTFSSLTLGAGFDSLNFGASNLSINDFSSFLTNITDTGTITLSGSIATSATWLGGGTVINDGTFAAPSGWQPAELGNNETFVNNGTVVVGIIIAAGDVIDNEAGAVFDLDSAEAEGGAVINNAGMLDFASEGSGNAQINSVVDNTGTIEFSAATAWGFNGGGSSSASSLLIDPAITLFFGGNASTDTFTITGGTFGGGGNLWIDSGAKVKFASSTQVDLPLHNDGSLEIAGGTLTVQQALTGSGTVTMDSGTTLALASPQGFTNTISGFSSGDTIDLIGTLATDISLNNSDQLVIADAGTAVATLQLTGNYSGTGLAFLVASDGNGGTAITLGVPNPPSVSAGAVVAFMDSAAPVPVTLDSSLAVIDRSNAMLTGATVTITSGFQTGDILAATTTGTSIAANYNSSTGILTLSGNDSLTDYESVLQSVTFSSSSNAQAGGTDPVRTISWTASTGAGTSAAADSAAIIADAAPSVAAQGTAAFEVDVSAPVALDPTLTLSDIDNSTLSGATVSIGFGFSAGDSLGVTTAGTAITVASNAGGVLTLAGTDTLQDYQKVLQSVTFATTNPTQDDRVITWSVDDGERSSALAASSVVLVNSTDDAQGNLIAQTIDNPSGSYWVDTFDPENTSNVLWSTSSYDANGNLLSQTTTNNDGTHSLTMYDVSNSYNWSSATINFDAQWNQTSVSGTNDDGSHTTTPKGLASAYDTALWFATPFDPNWNSTTPVTLTGDSANDFLIGNAGNDMLVAGTGNDILYGNGGSNTFAFGPGSGQDKVMDFQTDQDVIQFNPALFANYAAVMQDTTQVGANTVIQHDANTSVTLQNTLASNLTANNFHFS
jgi:hypothetical protein